LRGVTGVILVCIIIGLFFQQCIIGYKSSSYKLILILEWIFGINWLHIILESLVLLEWNN